MNDNIGNLIYNRRKELGLTLEEVGNAVGVSKSTVKKWENGFISNMRRDKIEKLSKILQVSPIRLLGITVKTTQQDERLRRIEACFWCLNESGKDAALERVEELTEIGKYRDTVTTQQ